MKHKKKIILLLLIVCLVIGGVGLKKYNDYQASNTYTFDYSQIEELETKQYFFSTALSDVLVDQIEGVNLLDEVNTFDVQYFINGTPIPENSDAIMLDYMSEENINNLSASDIILEYKTSESETVQSLKLKANFDNEVIKPLLIDVSKPFNPADYVVEVRDKFKSNIKFEIPVPEKLFEDVELLYNSDVVLDKYFGPHKIVLLSNKYIDIDEDEMFDLVYDGGFENVDAEYLEAVKNAFDSLPLNLKKHAVFSNLKICGSEFEFVDEAFLEEMKNQYGENETIESTKSTTAAIYFGSDNTIKFNVNKNSNGMHYKYINSFNNGSSISFDVDGDKYSIYKYGNKKDLSFHNISDMKNYKISEMEPIFYHEFGHYIDSNSSAYRTFSEEEMQALRKEYPYSHTNNFDYEHIAEAFSVYFVDNEYLKTNVPVMYSKLEVLLSQLSMKKVENYENCVDILNNWDN